MLTSDYARIVHQALADHQPGGGGIIPLSPATGDWQHAAAGGGLAEAFCCRVLPSHTDINIPATRLKQLLLTTPAAGSRRTYPDPDLGLKQLLLAAPASTFRPAISGSGRTGSASPSTPTAGTCCSITGAQRRPPTGSGHRNPKLDPDHPDLAGTCNQRRLHCATPAVVPFGMPWGNSLIPGAPADQLGRPHPDADAQISLLMQAGVLARYTGSGGDGDGLYVLCASGLGKVSSSAYLPSLFPPCSPCARLGSDRAAPVPAWDRLWRPSLRGGRSWRGF